MRSDVKETLMEWQRVLEPVSAPAAIFLENFSRRERIIRRFDDFYLRTRRPWPLHELDQKILGCESGCSIDLFQPQNVYAQVYAHTSAKPLEDWADAESENGVASWLASRLWSVDAPFTMLVAEPDLWTLPPDEAEKVNYTHQSLLRAIRAEKPPYPTVGELMERWDKAFAYATRDLAGLILTDPTLRRGRAILEQTLQNCSPRFRPTVLHCQFLQTHRMIWRVGLIEKPVEAVEQTLDLAHREGKLDEEAEFLKNHLTELARKSQGATATAKHGEISVFVDQSRGKCKQKKRSTTSGDAKTKIIAALILHHGYNNGACLNLEPVGCNELARNAEVSNGSVSRFFKVLFKGHRQYQSLCTDTSKLVPALKLLNGEYSPHFLYGSSPDEPPAGDDDNE